MHSVCTFFLKSQIMSNYLSYFIRYTSYPLIMGLSVIALLQVAAGKLSYWSYAPLIAAIAITTVALLERIQPFEKLWLADHQDTLVDLLHATFSIGLIFITAELVHSFRDWLNFPSIWSAHWSIGLQLLCAGLIMDFGLWFMHWYSHKNPFLWKLHALHHSPERLYWLNGERRHPLSAIVLGGPGVACVTLIGVPSPVIGAWMTLTAIHLAFQHANLDYSLGPFRHLFSVAEVHRWHHKQGLGRKNLGECFTLWDHLFRTYYDQPQQVIKAGQVGLKMPMPITYVQQLLWPFQRRKITTKSPHDKKSNQADRISR